MPLSNVELQAARRALMLMTELLEGLAQMARDAQGGAALCVALRDIYGRVADVISELDARLKKKD